MPGKLGLGLGDNLMSAATAVVIEDYFWDRIIVDTLSCLEPLASGSVVDVHDTWDLINNPDSPPLLVDYTPEAAPGDEGYWDAAITEQLVNGTFAVNANWSAASISGGQLTKGDTALATQSIALLQAGSEYIVTVDVDTIGAAVQVYVGGTSSGNLVLGQQTIFITAGTNDLLVGFNNGNGSTVINSISLVQNNITPLDV
tara:strand:+ start:909 stop:1508 length:600 start_codon:yes stop_codon:yes gene_type:complete